MQYNTNNKNLIVFLAILFIFGLFYPCYWTAALGLTPSMVLYVMCLCIWGGLLFIYNTRFINLSRQFNQFIIIFILYFAIKFLLINDFEFIVNIIQILVFYITVFLLYNSFRDKYLFMRYFTKWNIIMLSLTMIGLVLFYSGYRIILGDITMSSSSTGKLVNYGLFFVKVFVDIQDFSVIQFVRPAGYYDEPGSFAFIIVLLLIYNKLHTNNKFIENFLLYGGLVLLSMAYYVFFVMYVLFFKLKSKLSIILIVFLFAAISFLISNPPEKNTTLGYIYKRTITRFENILEGTDASRDYTTAFKAFKANLILGTSSMEINTKFPGATPETIWYFLALNGLLGSLIIYSPYIYVFFKYGNIKYTKILILLLLMLAQRPYYINPLYLSIIYFTFFNKREPKLTLEQ